MGMMDKFLNIMRLNADEEEDFYDDDYYDDDDDDYYEEPKRKSFRREKEQPEEDTGNQIFCCKRIRKHLQNQIPRLRRCVQVKKESGRKCCYGSMCDQTYICGRCPRNY